MFASTGDDRFKQRVDSVVRELAACQAAGGSGLVCAFPDGAAQFENSVRGEKFVGVPWYTMHKIFAGLRDAHIHAGNADALTTLHRLTDWATAAFGRQLSASASRPMPSRISRSLKGAYPRTMPVRLGGCR
jgi:DUF1680 family protein